MLCLFDSQKKFRGVSTFDPISISQVVQLLLHFPMRVCGRNVIIAISNKTKFATEVFLSSLLFLLAPTITCHAKLNKSTEKCFVTTPEQNKILFCDYKENFLIEIVV